MENLDFQAILDGAKKAVEFVKDSGILEKAIDAIKEYLPKIIEMLKGINLGG